MNVAVHCITDEKSLRAVIKAMKAADPLLERVVIPLDLWLHLIRLDVPFRFEKVNGSLGYFIEGISVKVRI